MLGVLNTGVEGFGGVAGEDGNFALGDDLAGVHAGVDEMHGATGLLNTGGKSLLPGFEAGKRGQQRGVDVDDPAREGLEEGCFDQPHVTGENYQFGAAGAEILDESALGFLGEACVEFLLLDHAGWNAEVVGEGQQAGVGVVRGGEDGLDFQLARHGGVEDGTEVRSLAGT